MSSTAPQAVDLGAGDGQCRDQARHNVRPRRPTHQYRMVHEHARHGRAEAAADRMHELPHASSASCARLTMPTRFVPVLERMAQYANNTTQAHVQPRVAAARGQRRTVRKLAAYLATVNLSAWPRLGTIRCRRCRARRAAPPASSSPNTTCRAQTIAPHDVRTDTQTAIVWFSDFVENFLGRLDPQDRRGHGISHSRVQAGLSDRLARSRARCRRQSLARDDVPDRARQIRHEDQDNSDFSDAAGP